MNISQSAGATGAGERRHHILVVDDTATNRQILSVFLKKLGHTIALAEDGARAVEMFGANTYDMVIMDVMMPIMDGYEATRRIKAMCDDRWVPVVFLSALDKDENLVAGLEAGGDDYLAKPVNFVVLEAKLRSLSRAIALRRELEDARRFNQAVTDNLLDAIITIDEHGQIETVNPACCRIFGYAPEELIGANIRMLMPEPHRSAHDSYLQRYLQGGAPHIIGTPGREVDGAHKDGSTFPLAISISEFSDEGRRMFVGALQDIRQAKAAERKLRENAAALQAYHDEKEAENALAAEIFEQLMQRQGLSDPALRYWMNPATNFSGDIVAAVRTSDGRFHVLLADATGHGLAAAISVLPVLTLFYDMVEFGLPLSRVMAKINSQLRVSMPVGRFVACSCLCIDPKNGRSEVWIGGMPNVVLVDATGTAVGAIPSVHLPLGIDDFDWRDAAAEIIEAPSAGCQLVLYSDGLVEAQNEAGEFFGEARIATAIAGVPADKRLDAIRNAVASHLGTQSPHDDVTVLLVDLPAPGKDFHAQ